MNEFLPKYFCHGVFSYSILNLELLLIPELPDLNEYGIFKRHRQQEKLLLAFVVKIKVVFIGDEKILLKKTVNMIQKIPYFLKHRMYLKENEAFFPFNLLL